MRYEERQLTKNLSEAMVDKLIQEKMVLLTTDTGSGKTFVTLRAAYLMDPNAHLLIFMPKAKIIEEGWIHSAKAFNEAMGANITLDQFTYDQLTTQNGPDQIIQAAQNIIHQQHYIQVPVTIHAKDTTFNINLKPYLSHITQKIHSIRVEERPFKKSTGDVNGHQHFIGDVNTKQLKTGEGTYYYTLRVDTDFEEESDCPKIFAIFDEAHLIKLGVSGTISKRAQRAIELTRAPYIANVIGVTATPAPNSYLDYGTYFVINGYYKNKTEYLKEQVRQYDIYHNPIIRDRKTKEVRRDLFMDPDKIEQLIHQMTVYADTSYVLPNTTLEDVCFDLDDQEEFLLPYFLENFNDGEKRTRKGHYREVREYWKYGYFESQPEALAVLRLIITEDPSRMRHLGRLTYDAFYGKRPNPVIIFYRHNLEKDALIRFFHENEHFPDVKIQQVNAKYKDVETPKDPHTIILIQYQAGGAAIEFPTSYTSIFFMPTYSYGDFKQGQGRNVRNGMTETVNHYILKANGTSDEDIWQIIEQKGVFTQKMQHEYFTVH